MGIRKYLKTYSGLNRSIYFLCLAQVVNSIGHFVHPFLTMFLTQKIGMNPVEAGTYVMLSAAVWVPGSLLGGKIADQIGRKKILVLFQSLAAAILVPCAFLGVSRLIPWLLIASSFLHGVAEPVNDAMITDRKYRPAVAVDDALQEIENRTGTQFDPDLVPPFLDIIRQHNPLGI